jgi:hypothetical protein
MKTSVLFVGFLFVVGLRAAQLQRAAPIVTDAELRMAAADVHVAKIDFTLPEKESVAEETLATRFFNQPEEDRFSGLTTADWRATWLLFSQALVTKAKAQGLDASSLDACLRALNFGRNRQTMLLPAWNQKLFSPGTPDEEMEAYQKKEEEKYALALKDREKNPEQWYDDSLAIVPVAAYLARYAKGDCWIVVCKWEMILKDRALSLGHIKVWAFPRSAPLPAPACRRQPAATPSCRS